MINRAATPVIFQTHFDWDTDGLRNMICMMVTGMYLLWMVVKHVSI